MNNKPNIIKILNNFDLTGAYCVTYSTDVNNINSKEFLNNDDTLYIVNDKNSDEIYGYIESPNKSYITGNINKDKNNNKIDIDLICVWSPLEKLVKCFAGFITIFNCKYDGDNGLECEYHMINYINLFKDDFIKENNIL